MTQERAQAVKQTTGNAIGKGKPGPGRPKGSQNKTTALLKDAILKAATLAGGGDMVAYLETQAKENPGPFLSLLGKVLPMQFTGEDGAPIKIEQVQADADAFTRTIIGLASRGREDGEACRTQH